MRFFLNEWDFFGKLFPDNFISLLFLGEPTYPSKED